MKRKAKKKEFRLEGYIFGALRKIWRWHPERKRALEIAKVHGSMKDHYGCAKCDEIFPRKNVHVDHICPVVDPKTGFDSWDSYITRLFIGAEGLQILCKECHQQKSNKENKKRRK